jgi:hypothetical protein
MGREVLREVGEHGCFAQAGRDAEENAIGSVGDFLLALLQEGDLSFEAASTISILPQTKTGKFEPLHPTYLIGS